MNVFPTRPAFHVALAGAAMTVTGVALHRAAPVAFGGALLLAVVLGRALSHLAATRIRRSGLEMGWLRDGRVLTLARGEEGVLDLELRNLGKEPARALKLRAIASSFLFAEVSPAEVFLPPGSAVKVTIRVVGYRAGRWGVHGLALELRPTTLGGDGSFDAPLVFSSPFGVEVQPWPLRAMLRSPRGGRSARVTEVGRPARSRGEGDELRELRDHVTGDPFKRIAWRASARRGRLVVREMDRYERDVVLLLVDASVDGWAGVPGAAPLDRIVDEAAAMAVRHLAHGDSVGLVVYASRPRAWIEPGRGRKQAALLAQALAGCSSMVDIDRSELDEYGVAHRVAEHLRPLTRDEAWPRRAADLDRLATLAESMRARAPFAARVPYATSPRDRTLRHYMACFGMEGPPKVDGERRVAESELGRTLARIGKDKPRPSIVMVWAPAPSATGLAANAIRALRARRIELRWTLPRTVESIGAPNRPVDAVVSSVEGAVRVRAKAEQARGAAILRDLGVKLQARTAVAEPDPHASREGQS